MKISHKLNKIANDLILDVKIDTITEDLAELAESITEIIEGLKESQTPLTINEILNQLRYKGFVINPVIIETVRDALDLEVKESKET